MDTLSIKKTDGAHAFCKLLSEWAHLVDAEATRRKKDCQWWRVACRAICHQSRVAVLPPVGVVRRL